MTEIIVEPLTDREGFLARWTTLFERAANASFYLSPAWMGAWLDDPPPQTQLFAVEARNNGAPVMMAAFALAPRRPPVLGPRQARLHEFGEASRDAVYIEYNDFLSAPDVDDALRVKALDALTARLGADIFVFRNARAPLAAALSAFAHAKGWRAATLNEQPVYAVDLAAIRNEGGAFVDTLHGPLGSKIRRALRRYEEERGPLTARALTAPDGWEAAWETMTALHAARWKPGVFANEKLVAFHERLRRAAPSVCELLHVFAGDKTVGVLYSFVHAGRVMGYQSGLRFEDDKRFMPGYACHVLACQHYLERGFDVYDMLAGEAEYKRRLGAPTQTLSSIALERPGWRNRVRSFVRSFRRSPERAR